MSAQQMFGKKFILFFNAKQAILNTFNYKMYLKVAANLNKGWRPLGWLLGGVASKNKITLYYRSIILN